MAKMTEWVEVDPFDFPPEPYGPRCPGPGTHDTWELAIEEGQVTLTSGCKECEEGLGNYTNPEEYAMDAIPIELVCHVEDQGDDHYVWWEMIPKTPKTQLTQPCRFPDADYIGAEATADYCYAHQRFCLDD